MSKNEKKNKTIKAMIELIEESVFPIDARGRELIAEILYDADFRDVGELKKRIRKLQDNKKDGMLVLLKDEVSELLESL